MKGQRNVGYIYIYIFFPAIKKKKIMLLMTIWMHCSQAEKAKYCISLHLLRSSLILLLLFCSFQHTDLVPKYFMDFGAF